MQKISYLSLLLLMLLLSCSEDENDRRDPILGAYQAVINNFDDPLPGHPNPERLIITITKHRFNHLLIRAGDFHLSLPVTKDFISATDDKIITLGYEQITRYSANGIDIKSGGSYLNSWGRMSGFYNATTKKLVLIFTFKKGSARGSCILNADQI